MLCVFLYQHSSGSITDQKSCLTCFHEVLGRRSERSTESREKRHLECRVTKGSPLSPTGFTVKPQRLIKGSLNLLPEMMLFFPETPCKKLGCRSNLMSSSSMWMSFCLKGSCHVPCGSVISHWLRAPPPLPCHPRVASQQVWIQDTTSHYKADPRDVFECWVPLTLYS